MRFAGLEHNACTAARPPGGTSTAGSPCTTALPGSWTASAAVMFTPFTAQAADGLVGTLCHRTCYTSIGNCENFIGTSPKILGEPQANCSCPRLPRIVQTGAQDWFI